MEFHLVPLPVAYGSNHSMNKTSVHSVPTILSVCVNESRSKSLSSAEALTLFYVNAGDIKAGGAKKSRKIKREKSPLAHLNF